MQELAIISFRNAAFICRRILFRKTADLNLLAGSITQIRQGPLFSRLTKAQTLKQGPWYRIPFRIALSICLDGFRENFFLII